MAFSFLYGVLLFDDVVTAMAAAGMLLIVGAGVHAISSAQDVRRLSAATADQDKLIK